MIDDLQGISLGVFLAGIGVHMLTTVGLITGQTAGVAVIASYLTGYSFGPMFFLINLPFYLVAWHKRGAVVLNLIITINQGRDRYVAI